MQNHTIDSNGLLHVDNLSVGGSLYLSGTGITTLPDNLSVGGSLDLDVENYINVSYKQNCGASGRTIFAVKLRESIKIAAGCFLGTYDEFCNAVDELYTGEAAEQYKQDGKEIVCTLQNKL